MLTMNPRTFTKLNKFVSLVSSGELPAIFRWTSDDLTIMFQRNFGKLLDFMTIFLASSDKLVWQAQRLLDWFLQNFR